MILAVTVGLLMAGAVYLFMQREMLRVILGFVLMGHAANLVLIAAGGTSRRDLPFGTPDDLSTIADPLPQAFVLTAIVISFSITVLMLVLAVTGKDGDATGEEPSEYEEFGEPGAHANTAAPGRPMNAACEYLDEDDATPERRHPQDPAPRRRLTRTEGAR